jgi:uncharacterized protein YdhG (YjbR/CyaY superfamily)
MQNTRGHGGIPDSTHSAASRLARGIMPKTYAINLTTKEMTVIGIMVAEGAFAIRLKGELPLEEVEEYLEVAMKFLDTCQTFAALEKAVNSGVHYKP